MRSEMEMLHLITETALQDENILAVYMNGSRANPNAKKDIFQDYDIVYVVNSTAPYIQDKQWIDRFGTRLIMQDVGAEGSTKTQQEIYGWLMLYDDGNRIDLHIQTLSYTNEHILDESTCVILLDKHDILPKIPESSDVQFHIQKPDEATFHSVCNEFWWCLNNVAKGIWRNELTYALDMLNMYVRPQLLSLLSWKAGIHTDFTRSAGKSGKYLSSILGEEIWTMYLRTYCGADTHTLDAIMELMHLFHMTAQEVAHSLQFIYHEKEADNMIAFVNHVFHLSRKAKSIY